MMIYEDAVVNIEAVVYVTIMFQDSWDYCQELTTA